jgi:hypothetical protein
MSGPCPDPVGVRNVVRNQVYARTTERTLESQR